MEATRTTITRWMRTICCGEASRLVLLGVLAWLVGSGLAAWAFGTMDMTFEEVGASTEGLILVLGFALGSLTVLLYATLRSLLRPQALPAMIGGGVVFFLPVVVGLIAPALTRPAVGGLAQQVLLVAPMLLLGYCSGVWLLEWDRKTHGVRRHLGGLGGGLGRLRQATLGGGQIAAPLSPVRAASQRPKGGNGERGS